MKKKYKWLKSHIIKTVFPKGMKASKDELEVLYY